LASYLQAENVIHGAVQGCPKGGVAKVVADELVDPGGGGVFVAHLMLDYLERVRLVCL
jgi:hypothetical protein